MGEGDAKAGTVLAGQMVEARAVAFAQLAGEVQAQARALGPGGEERLEQLFLQLLGDAVAVVTDLQGRQPAACVAPQLQPELAAPMALGAVAQAVLYQVVEYLQQLLRVAAGLQRGGRSGGCRRASGPRVS